MTIRLKRDGLFPTHNTRLTRLQISVILSYRLRPALTIGLPLMPLLTTAWIMYVMSSCFQKCTSTRLHCIVVDCTALLTNSGPFALGTPFYGVSLFMIPMSHYVFVGLLSNCENYGHGQRMGRTLASRDTYERDSR